MNKSLKYGKNAIVKGFTADVYATKFANSVHPTFANEVVTPAPELKKDYIFTLANQCRWWYEPEFADENKYLPVSNDVTTLPVVDPMPLDSLNSITTDTSALTKPPKQITISKDDLLKALVVGGGAILLYKILS